MEFIRAYTVATFMNCRSGSIDFDIVESLPKIGTYDEDLNQELVGILAAWIAPGDDDLLTIGYAYYDLIWLDSRGCIQHTYVACKEDIKK